MPDFNPEIIKHIPAVERMAFRLLEAAGAAGLHVGISSVPKLPLAMGHYAYQVEVRQAHPSHIPAQLASAADYWTNVNMSAFRQRFTTLEVCASFGIDPALTDGMRPRVVSLGTDLASGGREFHELQLSTNPADIERLESTHSEGSYALTDGERAAALERLRRADVAEAVRHFLGPSTARADSPSSKPEKCYGLDDETFQYESLPEALQALELQGQLVAGAVIYEGDAKHPKASEYVSAERILDVMGDDAHDDVGEWADGFPGVTLEQKAELDKMVSDWADANMTVGFWRVCDHRERVVTQEEVDAFRASRAAAEEKPQ